MSHAVAKKRLFVLTGRDRDLLSVLSLRLPLLTTDQVARGWWPNAASPSSCLRRLRVLSGHGLLKAATVVTAPPTGMCTPLVHWRPGAPLPEFTQVISLARHRGEVPLRAHTVVTATAAGAARSGVTPHAVRASDVAHDLLLAEVFLHTMQNEVGLVRFWRMAGRESAREGERVADAVIARPGRPVHIEVVGSSYTRTKLLLVHRYYEASNREYQLW